MSGLKRVVGLIKTRFTKAVNWLRTVRTETLLRIDTPLESAGIPEDAAAKNRKVTQVSLTQQELLWPASIFKSSFTETLGVRLAPLPPAKGLLKLVDILCNNASQSHQV